MGKHKGLGGGSESWTAGPVGGEEGHRKGRAHAGVSGIGLEAALYLMAYGTTEGFQASREKL